MAILIRLGDTSYEGYTTVVYNTIVVLSSLFIPDYGSVALGQDQSIGPKDEDGNLVRGTKSPPRFPTKHLRTCFGSEWRLTFSEQLQNG